MGIILLDYLFLNILSQEPKFPYSSYSNY